MRVDQGPGIRQYSPDHRRGLWMIRFEAKAPTRATLWLEDSSECESLG